MEEKMITKAMKYRIIKPTNCSWEELSKVLYAVQRECARVANYNIQLLWQWESFRQDHKAKTGEYPTKDKTPNFYQLVREKYPDVGTGVIAQVLQVTKKRFNADRKAMFLLKKSIHFYRDTFPIAISNQRYEIHESTDGYELDVALLPKEAESTHIKFIIHSGNYYTKPILNRLISGEYKQGMLQLKRDREHKWYAVISFSFTKKQEEEQLTTNLLEVSLNETEIVCKKGESITAIPTEHLTKQIKHIDNRIEQLKEQKRYRGQGRRGHGIKKIYEPQENAQIKKANFKDTANHNLSRTIVALAIKKQCSVITVSGEIPGWTNYDLLSKIKYKAEEAGIKVI